MITYEHLAKRCALVHFSGFDEDQDGEWWPPPLTEQDVAARQRAARLLQA